MSVRITLDAVAGMLKAIEDLTRQRVLIGIPGDAKARTRTGVGISNATLGYLHEYGSPASNIPARPFLRPGIAVALPAIEARLRAGALRALRAAPEADVAGRTLHGVGLLAQNRVRAYINAGVNPPLSPVTIHRRRTRKVAPRTGTVPLIDTGQLRSSITYVIVSR